MADKRISLTRKDLLKTWLTWINFAQMTYNYERLQGLGFAHTMVTVLNKFYKGDKEKMSEGLTRHMAFFNTESNWGAMVPGIVTSLEEERANGSEIDTEAISNIKTALMGPLAGIGDTVTQGLVKVILLGIGIDLALKGSVLGPILFVVLFSVYTVGVSYLMFFSGYNLGKNAIVKILSSGIVKNVTEALGAVGMIVLGGLVAKNIGISTKFILKLNGLAVDFQQIFDKILPKMLPLALFGLVYFLLRKKVKPVTIILIIFASGILLSYLKVLA